MKTIIAAFILIALAVAPAAAQVVVATGVAEDATEANSQPKIGIDDRGTVYLAFVKPSGGVDQIFVASSSEGRRWNLQQVTRATAHSRYPALAAGPKNTVHLAWTQYDNGVGKVYYSRYDGRQWSTPVKVSPGETYAGVPAMAVDAQGTVHLVWYGIRAEAPAVRTRHGSIYEILYTALRDGRWREPELISPGIPDSVNPALGIDGLGRLHSAWYQYDLRNYQVRHTLRDGRWAKPETVSSGSADALGVALAAGADGAAYVVWERRESGGSRIYFAEFRQRWRGQQQISPPSQSAFNPSVAVDEHGQIYVAWDSAGQVYLRRRAGGWLGTDRVTRDGKNTQPVLGAARGAMVLMWTQQLAGESRLQVATVAGAFGAPARGPRPPWAPIIIGLVIVAYYLFWAALRWRRSRKNT